MANGQFEQTHFADNTGGLNLADSAFRIADNQAAGGVNFDYTLTGGIRKRLGPAKVNSVADAQLRTLGLGQYSTATGSKANIRAAGTALQVIDTSVPSFTSLTADTLAASAAPLAVDSTQGVNFSQFNSGSSNILWAAGGGMTIPQGVYSSTKYTQNGVTAPAGLITTTVNAAAGGTFSATGSYYYAVVYRKGSTQATSNAALDKIATIASTTDTVTISLTGLTPLDTTHIDQIQIYRSAVAGVTAFTTGDLIAQLASTATSYTDTGTSIASAQNVPRAGNVVLDNSPLTAGTYNSITVFKRRLVVARDNVIEISDINKSESWPLTNPITVPSAGNITALAVISFTSPQAQSLDELLVIFKEREVWVVTGDDYTDWSLKLIDKVGCPAQKLIATANGFLGWVDYRGVYLWDGTSKPIYCSRLVEPLFARDGDIDKTKLTVGCAEFFRKENIIIWYLSSKLYGEQKFALKMDLRLTMPRIEQQLTGRSLDAVLIPDSYQFPIYSCNSYIPANGADEMMLLGDASGYIYFASNGYSDGGSNFSFTYKTKALCMEDPNTVKQFHKVIVWVQDIGDWNLTLDYWSDYQTDTQYQSTKALPISTSEQLAALWDVAVWDVSYWDSYSPRIKPLVFNLESGVANSNQGSAIQIQFRNETANQPIVIHGFSVLWSQLGGVTN